MPRPPLAVMSPPSNAEIDVSDMKVGCAASVGGARTRRSSRISKHGRKLGRKRPRLNEAGFRDCWCFLATLRRSDEVGLRGMSQSSQLFVLPRNFRRRERVVVALRQRPRQRWPQVTPASRAGIEDGSSLGGRNLDGSRPYASVTELSASGMSLPRFGASNDPIIINSKAVTSTA